MLNILGKALNRPPAAEQRDDIWARLCCEQAFLAVCEGNYGVGAVLVNQQNELVCEARNQVFQQGYQSQRHAEMELLNRLETEFAHLNRRELTLYVSLEPCLMCIGRILLSGIGRVRYLVADSAGGFASHLHSAFRSPLPPAWQNLASAVVIEPAKVQSFWCNFANDCIAQSATQMRGKVVTAWKGTGKGSR